MDASLLRIAWHGFERADSTRMQATARRVMERLGAGEGLLYRYKREPEEGAFGACGFWAVEYLAMGGGSPRGGTRAVPDQLRYASPAGLLSEEVDPETGDALGNIPAGFYPRGSDQRGSGAGGTGTQAPGTKQKPLDRRLPGECRVNWTSWLLWGFVATIALTTLSAGAQGLGLTRMSFPTCWDWRSHPAATGQKSMDS